MAQLRKTIALVFLVLILSACRSSLAPRGRTKTPTSNSSNSVPIQADNSNSKGAAKASPEDKRDPIPSTGNPDTRVWVNTNSGIYHCPGTPWYGNTKSGEYMTQKEAHEKGYRPAHRSVCG